MFCSLAGLRTFSLSPVPSHFLQAQLIWHEKKFNFVFFGQGFALVFLTNVQNSRLKPVLTNFGRPKVSKIENRAKYYQFFITESFDSSSAYM